MAQGLSAFKILSSLPCFFLDPLKFLPIVSSFLQSSFFVTLRLSFFPPRDTFLHVSSEGCFSPPQTILFPMPRLILWYPPPPFPESLLMSSLEAPFYSNRYRRHGIKIFLAQFLFMFYLCYLCCVSLSSLPASFPCRR